MARWVAGPWAEDNHCFCFYKKREVFKGGRVISLVLDFAHYLLPFLPQFVWELVEDGAYVGERIQRVHILCFFHCIVKTENLVYQVRTAFYQFLRLSVGIPHQKNCSALHFALVSTLCSNTSMGDKWCGRSLWNNRRPGGFRFEEQRFALQQVVLICLEIPDVRVPLCPFEVFAFKPAPSCLTFVSREQTKHRTMPMRVAQKMPQSHALKIKWMLKNARKVALRCIGCTSIPLPLRCISQPRWCSD